MHIRVYLPTRGKEVRDHKSDFDQHKLDSNILYQIAFIQITAVETLSHVGTLPLAFLRKYDAIQLLSQNENLLHTN